MQLRYQRWWRRLLMTMFGDEPPQNLLSLFACLKPIFCRYYLHDDFDDFNHTVRL